VVAKQYKDKYESYCGTAKFWTETYAVNKDEAGEAIAFLVRGGKLYWGGGGNRGCRDKYKS
jgi:hypothetical protein